MVCVNMGKMRVSSISSIGLENMMQFPLECLCGFFFVVDKLSIEKAKGEMMRCFNTPTYYLAVSRRKKHVVNLHSFHVNNF